MSKIKVVLDTNVFMMSGSGGLYGYESILSMIRKNTHVFVYLSCVEKELKKKASLGERDAITGLKRLDRIMEISDYEALWFENTYADDPILEFMRTNTDATVFISRDRNLMLKVHRLKNPHIQLFRISRKGRIHPFDPEWVPYDETYR